MDSHTALAKRLGATDEQLVAVRDGRYDLFEPGWRAALQYADAMTPTGCQVEDRQFAELARHWTAAQVVEITAVVALFNYFNRFAIALAIPVTR